jgi:hypothetical protein
MTDVIKDEYASRDQLAVVEKFEQAINYIYPILQNVPRKHGVARDLCLHVLFCQVELFIVAGKSGQPSRIYSADANLAYLRFWLRFLSDPKRRCITQAQHRTALIMLAEVGKMTGTWIRTAKGRG